VLNTPRGRLRVIVVAALLGLGMSIVDATAASADGVGYVRLAHLSPDTPTVDVYLNSVGGATPDKVFPGVGYGVLSDYLTLPTGAYAVSMRLAGAPASSQAVLTTQVTVASGKAYTVAGVGKHADLGLRVLDDDLTLPPAEKAKVRIIQASVRAPVLAVSVSDGPTIADAVPFATTTDYRQVDPGHWTLRVQPTGGGQPTTLDAVVAAGNVYSLLVLDAPGSGLSVTLRTDAQRQGGMPQGGVETGVGGAQRGTQVPFLVGVSLLVMLAGGLVLTRTRRVTSRRS